MAIKYGLSGAHGTGKSSLLNLAKARMSEVISVTPEAPRVLAEIVGDSEFFRRDYNTLSRQMLIFLKHLQQESHVSGEAVVISDRTLVDHWAYTESIHHNDTEYQAIRPIISNIVCDHCETYAKILYLPIEFAVEDDGIREADTIFQQDIDKVMRGLYRELNLDVIEITGALEERFSQLRKLTEDKL